MADDEETCLAELAVPSTWARFKTLPVTASRCPTDAPYQDDESHFKACEDSECVRCRFEAGFRGELRKGTWQLGKACEAMSWESKFSFKHPLVGEKTWFAVKPYHWSQHWGLGCWVCCHFGGAWSSTFARLEVCTLSTIQASSFKKHQESDNHKAALKRMQAALGEKAEGEGQFTGVGEMVPRLEKFHLAGTLVGRHDTFSDFEAYVKSLALTSILPQEGGDMSRKTCCKMLFAMAHPLKEQDMAVMRKESRPR